MANRRRGEIAAVVDGEPAVLCLTLGALAELETAFGVGDLVALAERFATGRLSALDLMRVFAAGLRGGGRAITDDEVSRLRVDGGLTAIAAQVADLLELTFGTASADAGDPSGGEGRATALPSGVPGAASPSPGTR
ncbi:MAG: gene transfer agent family protein [Siculibacillus sp.]|nr:gene transfer agent family protein [Siculibacillus sp.]